MSSHPGPPPPTCACLPPWPALTTVIEGTAHPVVPSPAHTPASALYLARCTGCGAPYIGPWKRLNTSSRAALGRHSAGRTTGRPLRTVAAETDRRPAAAAPAS